MSNRVPDLYTATVKIGSQWFGIVRLPWISKPKLVKESGEVVPFADQAKASQAASNALCRQFMDNTTGWRAGEFTKSHAEAEALFSKPRQEA